MGVSDLRRRPAVEVTSVQVEAAKLLIEMLEEDGAPVDERLRTLAAIDPTPNTPADEQPPPALDDGTIETTVVSDGRYYDPYFEQQLHLIAAAVRRFASDQASAGDVAHELRQLGVGGVTGLVPSWGPHSADDERALDELRQEIAAHLRERPQVPVELSLQTKDGVTVGVELGGTKSGRMVINVSRPYLGFDEDA